MSHSHSHHHDHKHSHGAHSHAHAAPVVHKTGFSLIAMSGVQRLALVLPVIFVLWLATLWAIGSGG